MAYKFNGTYRAVNTSVDGSHVKLMFARFITHLLPLTLQSNGRLQQNTSLTNQVAVTIWT